MVVHLPQHYQGLVGLISAAHVGCFAVELPLSVPQRSVPVDLADLVDLYHPAVAARFAFLCLTMSRENSRRQVWFASESCGC